MRCFQITTLIPGAVILAVTGCAIEEFQLPLSLNERMGLILEVIWSDLRRVVFTMLTQNEYLDYYGLCTCGGVSGLISDIRFSVGGSPSL